ncbi:MAG: 16S rRNA (adenine(1518)-N(6)/adenine(1519)-N(6))-dimethyltransferase RsmA [Acidobacteriota bacterium]
MGTRWGQNFLISRKYARRIAEQIGEERHVLEIGPGRGALTRELLECGATVNAVEIDPELSARLRDELGCDRLTIFNEDVLHFDFDALGRDPIFVIGNIPYQITAPLIHRLLVNWHRWSGIVLLVQAEVAERICAGAGSRDYSSLAVMVAAFATAERLFDVHRSHFRPRPQVDSALVGFRMRAAPLLSEPAEFGVFLKQLFSQRRKRLSNSLRHLLGRDSLDSYAWIGLDKRVEAIDPFALARLFKEVRLAEGAPGTAGRQHST